MNITSPGGIDFGIQGWDYGEIRPTTVVFLITGIARVCDHHGNPIEELCGPHAEVLATLKEAGFDWHIADDEKSTLWLVRKSRGKMDKNVTMMSVAGFPHLPYAELKKMPRLPETPIDELRNIKNKKHRNDALKARAEADRENQRSMDAEEGEIQEVIAGDANGKAAIESEPTA